jgi:hypothetical protein
MERLAINSRYCMFPGYGGVDAAKFRHRPYSMHAFEPVEIGYDLPCCRIEDDELISIHVRDVEPATEAVEALIVKANRPSGHRYIGDLFQNCWSV